MKRSKKKIAEFAHASREDIQGGVVVQD